MDRERELYFAKLAAQAERYDEAASHMENVVKLPNELSVEERKLLESAYRNACGSRRSAWRTITTAEQKEVTNGNKEQAKFAREYCAKVEGELQQIYDAILGLLDSDLISRATTVESKVFYQKMKGDYHRYMAQIKYGDEKSQVGENARKAYKEASKAAERDLAATNPIRLGLALNYSVLLYEVLGSPGEACRMVRTAVADAFADFDNIAQDSVSDFTIVMELLKDNLSIWTKEQGEGDEAP